MLVRCRIALKIGGIQLLFCKELHRFLRLQVFCPIFRSSNCQRVKGVFVVSHWGKTTCGVVVVCVLQGGC